MPSLQVQKANFFLFLFQVYLLVKCSFESHQLTLFCPMCDFAQMNTELSAGSIPILFLNQTPNSEILQLDLAALSLDSTISFDIQCIRNNGTRSNLNINLMLVDHQTPVTLACVLSRDTIRAYHRQKRLKYRHEKFKSDA
ncbi:unnamed protein product [Didymodactylos carnosus]|uniref:Uncharacterized protein n=1 Tax=Didymodactylos carnosus TaxID=1234261 RepID=A0A815QPJ1_9BILA|nr:unnamed protein product [Didymodactylos carnosus]CAF4334237.1 unnamed protein product [Didymodactylos carnosus]